MANKRALVSKPQTHFWSQLHYPTLAVVIILLLPLYYGIVMETSGSRAQSSTGYGPTGALSAITGAAVSGEPACPTFPAGAGIGGGCRLVGTTGQAAAVPLECKSGSGCTLRVISTVQPTAVYTISGDSTTAAYKRIGEIKYIQDPASNVVSLRGEVAGSVYTQFYTTYGSTTPGTATWLNYYLTSESASPISAYSYTSTFYSPNQQEQLIQGGSGTQDSIRFRASSSTSSSVFYYGYGMGADLPCQLSVDSSIEADPNKFAVQLVSGTFPAGSSCELYMCS